MKAAGTSSANSAPKSLGVCSDSGALSSVRGKEWFAVSLWMCVLAVVASWPVAVNLAGVAIGHELSGCWRTIWAHWWTLERIAADGAWPLTSQEIAFPRSGPFSSIAPVNDALSLPLQLMFGLVPAYNLVVLFHIVLAGTGAYALARQAGCQHLGGIVAGTAFGFNAFFLSYGVASAVAETQTMGWIAWFLAAVIWLVRHPGMVSMLCAAVLFVITALSSHYWALFAAMFSPFVGLATLRDRRTAGQPWISARLVGWVLLSVLVAGALFWVPGGALMETYQAQGAVLEDYADRKQELLPPNVMASHAHDLATLVGFLLPGKGSFAVHEDMDRLIQSTYAGWLMLGLALIGLGRGRRRWAVMAAVGMVLSCGPYLLLSESSYQEDPVPWWLLLRDHVPVTRMITSYVRFSVFFFIGAAVLAGHGAERLISQGRPSLLKTGLGLALAAAIYGEMRWFSPIPLPLPTANAEIPSASYGLATLPKEGAVLDWPQRYPDRSVEVSRYFFFQSAHARPIPYDFAPTSYMPGPIEGNPFFAELERLTYGADYSSQAWSELSNFPVRRGITELEEMGFAYIALHMSYMPPDRVRLVAGWLESRLPVVGGVPGESVVYEVRSPEY